MIYSQAMIQLHLHFGKFLECAKCSQSMLKLAGESSANYSTIFTQMIAFILLSAHSKDQQELTHQALQDKQIKSLPLVGDLVKIFCKKELIRWTMMEQIVSSADIFASQVFAQQNWKGELQKRVIEHVIEL